MPLLDELSDDAADLGAVNTVVFRDGRRLGRNTDWSGYGRAFRAGAARRRRGPGASLVGAGGAGVAVGYGLLEQGAAHVAVLDADRDAGRRVRRPARQAVRRRPGQRGHRPRPGARRRPGPGQRDADRDARPPRHGGARPRWCAADLWVSDVVYFPLETELIRLARPRGCRVVPGGGMAVHQAVGAFEYFTGRVPDAERMARHFEELTA